MRKRFLAYCSALLVLAVLALLSPAVSRASLTEEERKLLAEVGIARMMSTVDRLCSSDFHGRRAGSPENRAIADYLASRFKRAGLGMLEGLDGYRQPLTMRYSLVRSKDDIKAALAYTVSGKKWPVSRVRSFPYRNFNGIGGMKLSSPVVFVGHGIDSDYEGLDVTGKVVLWLSGVPKGYGGTPVTLAHKTAAAYQRGASACLMYRPAGMKEEWGTNIGLVGSIADFPCIAIDKAVADEILAPTGLSIDRLAVSEMELPLGARGAEVELSLTPVCDPSRPTCNLLGVIPGSDPEVADEIVILGAHYDHIGEGPRGELYPGADDNASGASVVLEVADILARTGLRPRRTIVFAAWTGEEGGLVGSNYFASNPPFPLDKIRSSIQLDMVGAGTPGAFVVSGGLSDPDHRSRLESGAADLGITLDTSTRVGASDNLALSRKKVPSSLVYSSGEHSHYHSTQDTPATLDRNVLEGAARFAALTIWRAATEDTQLPSKGR